MIVRAFKGGAAAIAVGYAARCRRHTTLPSSVVQCADNYRPVDVTLDELDQYFLPDPREELASS